MPLVPIQPLWRKVCHFPRSKTHLYLTWYFEREAPEYVGWLLTQGLSHKLAWCCGGGMPEELERTHTDTGGNMQTPRR